LNDGKPSESLVPSWSWASIPRKFRWYDFKEALKNVAFVGVRYAIEGPSLTGDIKEAMVRLQCPIISVLNPVGDASKIEACIMHKIDLKNYHGDSPSLAHRNAMQTLQNFGIVKCWYETRARKGMAFIILITKRVLGGCEFRVTRPAG
jgi:hypothetical protein